MSSFAISTAGLALIQQFEGFRTAPGQLPDGNWVVGFGHVRIGEAGPAVSREEAADLLALDLAPFERALNAWIIAPITQQQFDSLVSFAFSIGLDAFAQSDVLRRVNSGSFVAAACAMDAWRKSDLSGELEVIDALVRRRAAEKALFLADAPVLATPSAFMRAKLDHAASILGAPIAYAPAPQVGAIAVAAPKPAPAARLTEILKSEPATEALLLTRVATVEEIEEDEIVTAHAKPVARPLDVARRAAIRNGEEQAAARAKKTWRLPRIQLSFARSAEHVGLLALLLFGVGLVALGVSTLVGGRGDAIDLMGASALVAPGLAAAGLASFGLWRGPATQRAV